MGESLSLKLVDHLRAEGEMRPWLVDGVLASLRVYAESENVEVAKAAREAIVTLGGEDSECEDCGGPLTNSPDGIVPDGPLCGTCLAKTGRA